MEDDRILEALGNQYNPDILRAAADPSSAQDFSDELNIPIATCYRRLEELTEVGLLTLHDRVLSDEHRRTNVYRREVDEIQISFQGSEMNIDVTERPEVKSKLDDVWRTLSEES